MERRDGIEAPTPGFSGLGVAETIDHYRAASGRISGPCRDSLLGLSPIALDDGVTDRAPDRRVNSSNASRARVGGASIRPRPVVQDRPAMLSHYVGSRAPPT